MRKKLLVFVVLVFIALSVFSACKKAEPAKIPDKPDSFSIKDYFVTGKYDLTAETEGVDGTLELVQDKALKPRKQCAEPYYTELDDYETFKYAYIIIKSKNGAILQKEQLYSAWASVEKKTDIEPTKRPLFLARYYSSVGNPYTCGYVTRFYVFDKGRLVQLNAINNKTRKPNKDWFDNMWLLKGQLEYWEAVKSFSGQGKDILVVYSDYVSMAMGKPVTDYIRYFYNGKEWVYTQKTEKRVWNVYNDGFPPVNAFLTDDK